MKREARNLPAWPPNRLPLSIDPNLAAHGASRILDQGYAVSVCDFDQRRQVARHAHLMDRQDRPRARRYCFCYAIWIDIVGIRIDIDEDGICSTISDGVRGRDKRMAGRDHLVIRSDPDGK